MSGTPRLGPTTLATPFWYHGREKTDGLAAAGGERVRAGVAGEDLVQDVL